MEHTLAERFPHPNVRFDKQGELDIIELSNQYGSARLTTHGATLLSYRPAGGDEVIWVSDTAIYDGSKPVRGGVPVCWPWFGPYDPAFLGEDPSDANKKAHGVARYEVWGVESVRSVDAATEVVLLLEPNESIRAAWPHPFSLRLVVTLGEALRIELVGENLSDRAWQVSEALHTYFRVAEAGVAAVEGLEQTPFHDKLRGEKGVQEGTLAVTTPIERVHVHQQGAVALVDSGAGRRVAMRQEGGASVVVWNPGPEGAKGFGDMPDEAYQQMVCVEAGNALEDAYVLEPGASHTLRCEIAVAPVA